MKFVEQFDEPPSVAHASGSDLNPGRWLMMSDVCKHCAGGAVSAIVPTGAWLTNEFANVYIQPDISTAALYCVAACPFGVITRSHFDGHATMHAVLRSPERWLSAGLRESVPDTVDPVRSDRRVARAGSETCRRVHERGFSSAYLYGDAATETYSELNSFYLLIDRPDVYGLPATPFNPWLHMNGDYVRAAIGALASLAVVLIAALVLGRLTCRPRATPTTRRPNRRLGTPSSSGICSSITWRLDCFWSRPRPNWRRPARFAVLRTSSIRSRSRSW